MKLTSLPPDDGTGGGGDALLWGFALIVAVVLAVAMMGGQ